MAVLGIDIGGTKTIVAIADSNGDIIAQERISTPREHGPAVVLAHIKSTACKLIEHNSAVIRAIGIGCGGPLDVERGIIYTAPNLPGWENLHLAGYFSEAFGAPVFLDNDVTLAALGEARRGAGKSVDHFAYINLGTGVGGGIIIDGKIYRGCGNAGEFGHQIIIPDGPRCTCERKGCLESLVSGTSIARRAREFLAENQDSLILRYADSVENVRTEHLVQAARDGDDLALQIWRDTGKYLGIGLANVINILNPRKVIVGGGVMNASDLFLNTTQQTVDECAMTQLAKDAEIIPAALGGQAGIVGAVYLALESVHVK